MTAARLRLLEWVIAPLKAGVSDNLLLAGHKAKTDAVAAQGVSGHGAEP